ncbi:hypothetical protein DPMN_053734 [Dreissena polymorpha]|uniref:Uncharacterized protein n=1 Tax=Dreissena polymorpha TaxID=45954 RepID=A0A9D4CLX4_DREPO|nr:hypothetical protein DPMN_053734 [Dreissena polymorpha]
MHREAGNVSEAMVALNEKDMHGIRETIKQDNRLCGFKDETKGNVEGNTCYNNPLFNSGHTPFQGIVVECPNHDGQCTATVSETDVIGNEEKWN